MGKVITLGLQKGGVGKSTTTGALAHFLRQDGNKVLVIDMDSQGNTTELLAEQPANNFMNRSILEAIVSKKPKDYIFGIRENLDLLPANNFLALFPRWLYMYDLPNTEGKYHYSGLPHEQLNIMLQELRNEYDYILIDTPPSLSEHTTNALVASDYVVVLYECSKFCYSAIPNFMDSVKSAQVFGEHEVFPLGIIRTLNDRRRSDAKRFNKMIAQDFPDKVFDTIITRKAATGRLSFFGFIENHELDEALVQYKDFYKEFMERIKAKEAEQIG